MATYILEQVIRISSYIILWYVIVMGGIRFIQMVLGLFNTSAYIARKNNFEYKLMGASKNTIPISILIPIYNKKATVVDSIKSMLNLNYLNYEVIAINDDSTDETLETVINAFGLHKITYPIREQLATKKIRGIYYNPDFPMLHIIDKEPGGKADALNAGINLASYPYIVTADADSLLDPGALLHIAMAFMQNKYTVSVGGIIRVVNGCEIRDGKILKTGLPKKIWPLFQTMEYFHNFLVGRISWNNLKSLFVIPGAFSAFQKAPVLSIGGYTTGTLGEEIDLTVKLHQFMQSRKYKYEMSYLPDSVCWAQVPENLHDLYRQRRHWQINIMDVLGRFKKMFLNPRYGILGMLILPYYFLYEMISPIIELLGYVIIPLAWYLNFLSLDGLILFFVATIIFGIVTSIGSLAVEEFTNSRFIRLKDFLVLSFISFAENIFYRQMILFFRVMGIFTYQKFKREWGGVKRKK